MILQVHPFYKTNVPLKGDMIYPINTHVIWRCIIWGWCFFGAGTIPGVSHHFPFGTTGTCMFHLYSWHHLPWFRLGTSNFVSLEGLEVVKKWEGTAWDFFKTTQEGGSIICIYIIYIYIHVPFTKKTERYGYRIALATYLGVGKVPFNFWWI